MLTLGIVGGIGSGKSRVAECFRDLGAALLDADRAGHAVLREPEIIAALSSRWGNSILDPAGQINRRAVAKIVFASASAAEREFLERLTHPRIEALLEQELAAAKAASPPHRAVVIDAALLFEAGWNKLCDKVIFVDAPRDVRLERAVARGWSADQFAAREAAQMSPHEKRQRADIVIRNVRTLENLRDVVRLTWQSLVAPTAGDATAPQSSADSPGN